MLNILCGLLAKEDPPVSAIIDSQEVNHRDLSIIEVRYVQGGKYYAAKSYATETWLASTPLGPTYNADGCICMDCVRDVAEVQQYDSANALKRRRWPTMISLVQAQGKLDATSFELVRQTYPSLGDQLYKTSFTFTPIPTILIALADGKQAKSLIGIVALSMHGDIHITSRVRPEIDDIVKQMRGLGHILLPEELSYE